MSRNARGKMSLMDDDKKPGLPVTRVPVYLSELQLCIVYNALAQHRDSLTKDDVEERYDGMDEDELCDALDDALHQVDRVQNGL